MIKIKILQIGLLSLILAATSQAATSLNIIFGYTPNVKNANGGSTNTKAKISDRVVKMRNGHNNSVTNISFVGKGSYETGYNTSNQAATTQLTRLASGWQLSGLRSTGDNNNADLIQLFCQFTNTDISGQAQIAKPYSIVKANELTYWNHYSQTTMAHEIGHNLNALHGTGYCLSNNKRTIMADDRDCTSNYWNLFSAQWRWFGGVDLGDSTHNTREVMIQQAPTSANFR